MWNELLKAKILNQAYVLDLIGKKHNIYEYLKNNLLDEGNISRIYFKNFFSQFGKKSPDIREHQNAENSVNKMLNYIYAIFSSILHRSIVIHGLNACLGVHHKYRFKSYPLVYDLVEPLRALGDLVLLKYYKKYKHREIESFVKYVAKNILDIKISFDGKKKFNLINATDIYVSSIALFYKFCDIKIIKMPILKGINLED